MAQADLAAGADAEVVEVSVRVGDRVQEGDPLVRLDPSLARTRVAAARASRSETAEELEQARRDRERAERLGHTVLPQAEIERDQTRVQTLDARSDRLKASEREAKAQLSRHRVVAPFSGVISARLVDPGDWVAPGDPVLSLIDDERVEIIVAGSAELVQRVQTGTRALVTYREHQVSAEIVGIVRALDPATRTARLRLLPEKPETWLLPGISLDVSFEIDRDEEGVLVPRDALVYGAVGTRVIRVTDGKAESVPVEVIATADDEALVSAQGLAEGDTVVIRGNERLRPGQPVVIEAEADEASG